MGRQGLELEIRGRDTVSTKLRQVGGNVDRMKRRIQGASARISGAFAKMGAAAQRMGAMVKRHARNAALAIGALATAAIVVGAKFEQTMVNVGAVAGATQQELAQLATTARDWGSRTAFSASQVGDAMYSLASAGQSVEQIRESVGSVLLFAGATMTDMASASELVVKTLSAFRLEASEAARVSNVFTAAITKTQLTSERLAMSLPYAAATAKGLGLSIETTTAAIGELVSAGQEASTAGTGLRQFFAQLLKPGEELREALNGVTIQTHGLTGVIRQLQETVGADPEGLAKMFNVRALNTAQILIGQGADKLDKLTAAITGTNKAAEVYEKQMDTVSSQFRIFRSAVEESFIAVFNTIRPQLRSFIASMIDWVERTRATLIGLIITGRDVIRWVHDLIAANSENIKVFGKVTIAVVGLAGAWALWNAQMAISVGLLALLRSRLLIAAAIITTISLIWIKWGDQITEVLRAAAKNVSRFANKFMDDHRAAINSVGGFFKDFLNFVIGTIVAIGTDFWKLGNFIVEAMREPIAWIWDKLKWFGQKVADLFGWLGIEIAGSFEEGANKMEEPFRAGLGVLENFTNAFIEQHKEAYSRDYVGAVGSAVSAGVEKVGEGLAFVKAKTAETFATIGNWGATLRQMGEMQLAMQQATQGQAQDQIDPEEMAARLNSITQGFQQIGMAGVGSMGQLSEATNETFDQMEIRIGVVDAAYGTMVDTALDKELTGQKRREKMWKASQRVFLKSSSEMAKGYLKHQLTATEGAQKASLAAAAKQKYEDAKAGARAAYHAFAAIPIIGPALGAAAAAAAFAFLIAFHKGGLIGSFDSGRERVIRAETGEYVVQRSAVAQVGTQTLDYINRTGQVPATGAGPQITVAPTVQLNPNLAGVTEDDVRELMEDKFVPELESLVRRRILSLAPTT